MNHLPSLACARSRDPLIAGSAVAKVVAVTALAFALGTGCDGEKASSAPAISDVLQAIGARGEALSDFELDGSLVTSASAKGVQFKFYQRAPNLLRLDVVEEKTRMTFDGQTLAILKDEQKTAVRQSFAGQDPATQIITLRNAFGSFASEGWRPPTLSPKSAQATLSQDEKYGPIWTVVQPLQDATLKEVRYKLRAPKADFISKETMNKAGEVVAYVRMSEEHSDADTGMKFPKKWSVKDAAREYTVTLTQIAINKGIKKTMFATTPPEGYKVHTAVEKRK